jgi:hypothetical protein
VNVCCGQSGGLVVAAEAGKCDVVADGVGLAVQAEVVVAGAAL